MRNHPLSIRSLALVAALLGAAALPSCFGSSSLSSGQAAFVGAFKVESINLADGDIWALNRPIVINFNHPVDPASVGFTSIIIRPVSPGVQGHPVTGSFEILAGSGGKTVVFRPACPTNSTFDNGAFVPGGYEYELALPTESSFGSSVVRDRNGKQLSVGLSRRFFSPTPPTDPLFIDTVVGPPVLEEVVFPGGLNLFTDPDGAILLRFNQAIDASPGNLNADRIQVLYSAGTRDQIPNPTPADFPIINRVPGRLVLLDNCSSGGALVNFQVTGVLPPNRWLRVVVRANFSDVAGETGSADQTADHPLPTLAEYYGDPSFDPTQETVDEIQEEFLTAGSVDPDADTPTPPAEVVDGRVQASFDFPGVAVPADADFYLAPGTFLEVDTSGIQSVSDSNGRIFTFENGVLYVDDFTLDTGSTLRGKGDNPLVLYATGTVTLLGTLDVSGEDAQSPKALNAPRIPEPGAHGQCGGGDGGSASLETDQETRRGEPGDGPFGDTWGGGGGGEGAIQSWLAWADVTPDGKGDPITQAARQLIAGGGAGGNFAQTPNAAVTWDRWPVPKDFDDAGPDVRFDRHTKFDPALNPGFLETWFLGAEDGLRGTNYNAKVNDPPGVPGDPYTTLPPGTCMPGFPPFTTGPWGMEDVGQEVSDGGTDDADGFDPPWTGGDDPPFFFGLPELGPDPGFTNPPPFDVGGTEDDFWGRRFNADGTVTRGEFLAPWAGYGGGASGDTTIVARMDLDGDCFLDPISSFFPDPTWPNGTTVGYLKGAPGGGGGGQLLVMAIGPIILGPDTQVKANGGSGAGGESLWKTFNQVSGSGGGSGGHLVLHTATGLDLSRIDFGTGPLAQGSITDPTADLGEAEVVQAIGGRRGWAVSRLITLPSGAKDGNSDFMAGRGGAGANGIIQIHVPDPAQDIAWHPDIEAAVDWYIRGNSATAEVNTDLLEDVLDAYTEPAPVVLIPFYGPKSQVQSHWIDTGLALLRNPSSGTPPYPDYGSALLHFQGTDTTTPGKLGDVLTADGRVLPGPDLITGSTAGVTFGAQSAVVDGAAGVFGLPRIFQLNPQLLVGYDVVPDVTGTATFQVVDASYDPAADRLVLTTRVADGSMSSAVGSTWSLRQRFFRVDTSGFKDRLPANTLVRFEFQGADEGAPGSNLPDPASFTAWVADPALLKGKRFVRFRLTFDLDAQNLGVGLNSERPAVDYLKLPFAW